MSRVFLSGAEVLVDRAFRCGCGVLLHGGAIEAVLPDTARPPATRINLPPGSLLCPGLVDVQVNGGGGVLFNDTPTREAALAIAAAHRRLGTTAILPTLITDTPAAMRRAAEAIRHVEAGAGVLGIHFEGPFLSRDRPGVHRSDLIRPAEEDDLAWLERLAGDYDGRVLLTLAPEAVDDAALRRLASCGVILSAGHSTASFERMEMALKAGVTGFTHLFNAMPGPAARMPGLVVAALLDEASTCGVIADGIHVHPAMLRLLLARRGPDRVMLVSDAMSPTGTDLPGFVLQGRPICRRHGRLETEDGVLAGADICLADAVRFCVQSLGMDAPTAIGMASHVPARFLGLDNVVGRIAAGGRADLLLLTPALEVLGTWLRGVWQGEPGVLPAMAAA